MSEIFEYNTNIKMSDSFYYFFSATPQVLSGILGLFGVFVLFKIQDFKAKLSKIVQSLYDESGRYQKMYLDGKEISFYNKIEDSLKMDDPKELKMLLEKATKHSNIENFYKKYKETERSQKALVKDTVKASILTAIVIMMCLGMIPLGCFWLASKLLSLIFIIFVIETAICIYQYILILKKVMYEYY